MKEKGKGFLLGFIIIIIISLTCTRISNGMCGLASVEPRKGRPGGGGGDANAGAARTEIARRIFRQTIETCLHLPAPNSKGVSEMRYLVTLYLLPNENTLQYVKELNGLKELKIDEDYGLVLISPKRNLYTIRVSGDIDPEKLMSIQPKVKGVYGDVKIAPIKP